MNRKLLALYGLKFNPFAPELPTEALWIAPEVENFLWRIQFALVREGGFALLTGESGSGKSVILRLLSERLAAEPDLVVGAISRPQANVADFYRELGELFGVPLRPHNRWGGRQGAAGALDPAPRHHPAAPPAAGRRGAGTRSSRSR